MHEWESQEKILSALELQDVENFMVYKDFQYQRHEWDNIPIIVPRYIIYLSKYIKGLSSYAKWQDEQESAASLRSDLDSRYQEMLDTFKSMRDIDLSEKERIGSEL
jgi:hypothetical protein